MSGSFDCRFGAKGSVEKIDLFVAFVENDWIEMKRTNTILKGFSRVGTDAPTAARHSLPKGQASVVFDFHADGPLPAHYIIALSTNFPELRLFLVAADGSDYHWLADAAVAYKRAWALAEFKYGRNGCQTRNTKKLLEFLADQADTLASVIDDDGNLVNCDRTIGASMHTGVIA